MTTMGLWLRTACAVALWVSVASLGGSFNSQPWPVVFDQTAGCCSLLQTPRMEKFNWSREVEYLREESSQLDQCLKSFNHGNYPPRSVDLPTNAWGAKGGPKVALLSMAFAGSGRHGIENIQYYRPYHIGIMSAYAEHHGYAYRCVTDFDPAFLAVHKEDDERWLKIRLLLEALDPITGWARGADYIMWIDSDAVIVDFSLDVASLVRSYPQAHLIVSSDVQLGMINSGIMVLKNSQFMLIFLQEWHDVANRSAVCDQEAFDLLYHRRMHSDLAEDLRTRIVILATDAINSHPPVWKHLSAHTQVVHMMGEHSLYRGLLFRFVYTHICNARSRGGLRRVCGLTALFAQETGRDVYTHLTQELIYSSNRTSAMSDEVGDLVLAAHHYVDLLEHMFVTGPDSALFKGGYANKARQEILGTRQYIFMSILHKVEVLRRVYYDIDMDEDLRGEVLVVLSDKRAVLEELVALMKQGAEAGNALFWAAQTLADRERIYELTSDVLTSLRGLVAGSSIRTVEHMQALMEQNIGVVYLEEAMAANVSIATGLQSNTVRIDRTGSQTTLVMVQEGEARLAKYILHLNSSVTHLSRSLELFDNIAAGDGTGGGGGASMDMELVQTAQSLAMAVNHDAHLYDMFVRGETLLLAQPSSLIALPFYLAGLVRSPGGLWNRAIAAARDCAAQYNGVAEEKLGAVLYNAALSLSSLHSVDPLRPLDAARAFANESVAILAEILAQKSLRSSQSVEAVAVGALLRKARDLAATMQPRSAAQDPPRIQIEVMPDGEKKYFYVDEEWEECDMDADDCVDFVVEEVPEQGLAQHREAEQSRKSNGHVGDSYVTLGLTHEDALALDAIRGKYVHATKEQRDMGVRSEIEVLFGKEEQPPVVVAPAAAAAATHDRIAQLEAEVLRLRRENGRLQQLLADVRKLLA